mmetsp:Transcript_19014/g.39625  ORF Transcript_19014/g.39625 Transcript_19014/m.39625 type:complete len:348 (-) Transcript_19014:451-1494(-)
MHDPLVYPAHLVHLPRVDKGLQKVGNIKDVVLDEDHQVGVEEEHLLLPPSPPKLVHCELYSSVHLVTADPPCMGKVVWESWGHAQTDDHLPTHSLRYLLHTVVVSSDSSLYSFHVVLPVAAASSLHRSPVDEVNLDKLHSSLQSLVDVTHCLAQDSLVGRIERVVGLSKNPLVQNLQRLSLSVLLYQVDHIPSLTPALGRSGKVIREETPGSEVKSRALPVLLRGLNQLDLLIQPNIDSIKVDEGVASPSSILPNESSFLQCLHSLTRIDAVLKGGGKLLNAPTIPPNNGPLHPTGKLQPFLNLTPPVGLHLIPPVLPYPNHELGTDQLPLLTALNPAMLNVVSRLL